MTSYVKLRTYVSTRSKIIKQEVKLSSVVCPYEGFKSMRVKVIKTRRRTVVCLVLWEREVWVPDKLEKCQTDHKLQV